MGGLFIWVYKVWGRLACSREFFEVVVDGLIQFGVDGLVCKWARWAKQSVIIMIHVCK